MNRGSYKSKAGHGVGAVGNEGRERPCSVLSASKCNHITSVIVLPQRNADKEDYHFTPL